MPTVYNKLFTKILDSSIWLASDTTRIVWITLIAAMDEDGFCPFATVENLAARARVEIKAAKKAVAELESPEPETATADNDGRRIERVPGGWLVINADKYRKMVTRLVVREQTRERVKRHRARNASVTACNASLLNVTPSEAVSEAVSEAEACTTTREKGNPTLEMALGWALEARKSGATYSDKEVTSAFHALNANGWMWGKNPVRDYRSALERQINTDRDRKHENTTRSHGKGADRNQGTYNERHKNDYANAAIRATPKVSGVQNPE